MSAFAQCVTRTTLANKSSLIQKEELIFLMLSTANSRNKLRPQLHKLYKSFFWSLVLCSLSILGCDRSSEVGLNPEDTAPKFKLERLASGSSALNDFKGKLVVLNFFASWCATCIEEMPSLERLQQQFGSDCLSVVAVAVDDEESKLKPFVQEMQLSFPILLDRNGKVRRTYKVAGYPETFILDRDLKVKMFYDYEKSEPVARVIGPRDWMHPEVVSQIERICNQEPNKE